MARKVPRFLKEHYDVLSSLISNNQIKDAKIYLYNLPPGIYDAIIERAIRGSSFETIVNKIEGLTIVKKTNELFKLNNYDSDDTFIF